MQFHDKLDFLMCLTDITNSKLAKDANIDPSLISRWRRGIKVPVLHSDAVLCIARALVCRISDDFRKTKFSEISETSLESLSDEKGITKSVLEWFADGQPTEIISSTKPLRRKPYPSYHDRRVSPLDSLSVAESYCIGKEGRIKALQWIMSFVEHWPSGGTLRFYTDQSTEWLKIDHNFFLEAAGKDQQLANKFNIVKILLPVNSPTANHSLILEFAKIFMETATVSINYVRQDERSMFQHSMGIYDNNVAISCFGFYSKHYLPTHLHSDERFIHELATDFEANFNSSEIALRFVPRFTIWDMCRAYSTIFMQNANAYYRSSQVFLPFVPVEVMNEVMDETELKLSASGFAYERLSEQLGAFLEQNMLFVSVSADSFRFSPDNRASAPCLFTQEDQRVFFTPSQCRAILENMLVIFEKCKNLVLLVEDRPVEDHFLIQERLKLMYARINDRFIPYQSHHPHLVQVICKKIAGDFSPSLKDYSRARVSDRLRELIGQL
ncbi:MAG: helix-turn-helix transcriptional regulator [Oscillospiraceae bacterium]|nr:helix-turn-helix transcriptional regulator [Oscillospiraceae bacterium]